MRAIACSTLLVLALAPAPVLAQQKSPYAEYQRMANESAPIELFEIMGEEAWKAGRYEDGAKLFEQITAGEYVEFLTLPAYDRID